MKGLMTPFVGGRKLRAKTVKLTTVFASGLLVCLLQAQPATSTTQGSPGAKSGAAATPARPIDGGTPATYRPSMPRREIEYYSIFWGIDTLSVKAVESGELIRLTWRVLDSDKAKTLNDEKVEPFLIDPAARAKLVVPELPFMGKMRVKNKPEAGMVYWMAFSNPGKVVKPGDHVNVVIGQFHVNGLVVQ